MNFNFVPDWRMSLAADYCERVADGTHDSPKFLEAGFPLVTSRNLKNGKIDLSDANFISAEDFEEINKRSKVHQWDVIFTMIGTVGELYLVKEPHPNYAIKNVGLFKCGGDELAGTWLYYYLSSPQIRQQIHARKKGTTQQYVALGELRKLPIYEPSSLAEKSKITELLRSLDDRIDLLRETNSTLEAISQSLFKSWFVDFDPVRAKMDGRIPDGMDEATAALFPDELDESQLGTVPIGWKLVPFGQLLSHTIGGDWGTDAPNEKNSTRVAIIRGTDIPDIQLGVKSRVPIRYTSEKKLATRKLKHGDIVLEVSGGSKNQPTGRAIYLTNGLLGQFDCAVEPASFCRLLRPCNKEVGVVLSQHLAYIYGQGKTWEYQNQSTGIANFQTTHFLATELVVIPSQDVLDKFFNVVSSIIERTHLTQIQELSNVRDTLLPRLISGQLRISEAEAEIESIAA